MIAEVAAQRCVQPVVVISFKRTPARIQFTGHDDLPNSLPLESAIKILSNQPIAR
ncbi:MAG TPA: hypothetical protein VFP43_11415 [Mesorhizobium sp.]|jgi:hypothetical protein|nr:hypothetical protein [Mesorhizobium sp.]